VTRQIQGVDQQPVELGLFTDLIGIVTGPPTGTPVIIRFTARNSAGETLPTELQAVAP
jgi:hypothetical protein